MKNEKGYALLLTVLTIVIVAVIGVGLITVTANSNKTTVHERQNQSLYYIAEAGINLLKSDIVQRFHTIIEKTENDISRLEVKQQTTERYLNEFNKNLESLFCFNSQQGNCGTNFEIEYNGFKIQNGKMPIANVTANLECHLSEMNCKITLTSLASYKGDSNNNRKVEQTILVDQSKLLRKSEKVDGQSTELNALDFLKGFAIFTTGSIDFSKSYIEVEKKDSKEIKTTVNNEATIKGAIGSTLESSNDVLSFNNKITKELNKNGDVYIVDVSKYKGIDLNQLLPTFPSSPIVTKPIKQMFTSYNEENKQNAKKVSITKDELILTNEYSKIENINTAKDSLEIKLNKEGSYTLFVDNLSIDKTIEVSGEGILNIVVSNNLILSGIVKQSYRENVSINLVYDGTDPLDLKYSNSKIEGNLFVRNANVYVSNKLRVEGNYIQFSGNLKTSEELNIEKEASLKVDGNIYMDNGSMELGKFTEVNNLYLNKVNLIVKKLVNIYGDIYVKEGNVTVLGTVDVDGNLVINYGDFIIGKVDGVQNSGVLSNAYVKGNTYIGYGDLLANKLIDLEGNLYYKGNGTLTFKDKSEIDEYKGRLVLAPNGKVVLDNDSKIKGTIVAKTVEGYDEAKVTYEKIDEHNAYLKNVTIHVDQYEFSPLNNFLSESPLIER